MSQYLTGFLNVKYAPNENYAREFMEHDRKAGQASATRARPIASARAIASCRAAGGSCPRRLELGGLVGARALGRRRQARGGALDVDVGQSCVEPAWQSPGGRSQQLENGR